MTNASAKTQICMLLLTANGELAGEAAFGRCGVRVGSAGIHAWARCRSWGYGPSGALGLILLIPIVLILTGRLCQSVSQAFSTSAHRVAPGKDTVDQRGHGDVQRIIAACRSMLVRGRRVRENPDDFFLRQDLVIVQCKQQRLADGQCCGSGDVVGHGHGQLCFQLEDRQSGIDVSDRLAILGLFCYAELIQSSLRHRNSS